VLRANNLESGYLRPIAFYGSEKMGVSPKGAKVHVAIAAWPWGAYLGEEGLERGIRVKVSSYTRHHVNISMVRAKASGHYINSILANNEVTNEGYDEAMLLDPEGYVAEGAGENLFIVKKGKLYTPDLTSCLEGITRATVLQIADELGLAVQEKRITRDEVYCCDEAFFTGTAAEVTPIRELDGRQIGIGRRGPVTARSRPSISTWSMAAPPRTTAGWPTSNSGRSRCPTTVTLNSPPTTCRCTARRRLAAVVPASARLSRRAQDGRGGLPLLQHKVCIQGRSAQGSSLGAPHNRVAGAGRFARRRRLRPERGAVPRPGRRPPSRRRPRQRPPA
jgi:branched-subunit amino acid aminotransferase/4-amino-4-deoxychorismate lyase